MARATITAVIAALCLLLTLSGAASSEPDESQTASPGGSCPPVCTCHLTERSLVPLVRFSETGDRDHDSEHHWQYYHQRETLNGSSAAAGADGQPAQTADLVVSVVCALQFDTDTAALLQQLPVDTKFLSLLQAPDLPATYIRAEHFSALTQLEGLEIHGFHAHDDYSHDHAAAAGLHGNDFASMLARAGRHRGLLEPAQPASARIALSPDALRPLSRLTLLSLEHVLLSPEASGGPAAAQYQVVSAAGGDGGAAGPQVQLVVAEQPEVVPYNEFRLHAAPQYSSFANLTSLEFLRLAHSGLEELQWQLFEGLSELKHLRLEHQLVRTLPDFAFFGCPALQQLSLAGNRLLTVNMKGFAGLLDLETLDLSDNLISELSYVTFAPFPRLRELSLAGNPVSAVLEGALDMMNGTEVLRLGAADTPLTVRPRALRHLSELRELSVANLTAPGLRGELLAELPQLRRLELHGDLGELRFDAFSGVPRLERLDVSRCRLEDVSQDAFLGLGRLTVLDLSHNALTELAAETFSPLSSLRELYLHHNHLSWLSPEVLSGIRPKLLQLQHNPWECTCQLAFLSAAMTNKARSEHRTVCEWDSSAPGGRSCHHEHRAHLHYDARLEPRCHQPEQFRHWGLYEVLQQQLRCRRRPAAAAAGRARAQLHPEAEDVDYLAAPDADVVLLDDRQPTEDDEYDYSAAAIADQELAMAEYSADDYAPESEPESDPEPVQQQQQPANVLQPEPEPEYATIPPEMFAKLSKKAQKLERERMNPKFRKFYNL
ncbi:Leucine-rich repeat-containing protein 70 [Amphibalanus amphitrite]|uniref:Leucine-rich repeat-containing protein 70 n=1 Tax=Amphibalanus amphitrite TaxID=1232801 RepID=A0A6A4V1E5_AMPAM|nr:Leucine-rich repeat-containing protein 70 [Amphibalanus amphitrite]